MKYILSSSLEKECLASGQVPNTLKEELHNLIQDFNDIPYPQKLKHCLTLSEASDKWNISKRLLKDLLDTGVLIGIQRPMKPLIFKKSLEWYFEKMQNYQAIKTG